MAKPAKKGVEVTEAPETLEQALEVIAALKADNETLNENLAKAEKTIEELMAANAKKANAPVGNKFTYEKQTYVLVTPSFYHKGKKITAAVLADNEDLLAELIVNKTGNLIPEEGDA